MMNWNISGIALVAATLLSAGAWAGEGPAGHSHAGHGHVKCFRRASRATRRSRREPSG